MIACLRSIICNRADILANPICYNFICIFSYVHRYLKAFKDQDDRDKDANVTKQKQDNTTDTLLKHLAAVNIQTEFCKVLFIIP